MIILIYPINSFSQISDYGFKFGIQSAGVYNNLYVDGRVYGFSLYGFTDFFISQSIFISADLGVTQRGFKSSMDERNENGEFVQEVIATSRLTYISLTPFINFSTSLGSSLIYLGSGPRFDYLVNKEPGKFSFTTITVTDELVNYLDKLVFGVSIMAGIKNVTFYGINFRFEGKYEIDITDSMSKYPAKYRNNIFMLAVGVSL